MLVSRIEVSIQTAKSFTPCDALVRLVGAARAGALEALAHLAATGALARTDKTGAQTNPPTHAQQPP
jgi:hypothetical protein